MVRANTYNGNGRPGTFFFCIVLYWLSYVLFYEPYLDGLFTYCLSVLCDHDTATAALGDVLALAERRGTRGPEAADDRRAWLYALARWACLRKLAETRRRRQGAHASVRGRAAQAPPGATPSPRARHGAGRRPQRRPPRTPRTERRRRPAPRPRRRRSSPSPKRTRRSAAANSPCWPGRRPPAPPPSSARRSNWPYATSSPPTRSPPSSAWTSPPRANCSRSAACEVERTRAALAVVETGTCPSVARLTGDNQLVLSTALRRELVRHVDDCPRCRRTAERAVPGILARHQRHARRAARPARPRARPCTSRWRTSHARGAALRASTGAASRWTPRTARPAVTGYARVPSRPPSSPPSSPPPCWPCGRPTGARPSPARARTAARSPRARRRTPTGSTATARRGYENAGNASTDPDPRFTPGSHSPDVSVEVISVLGSSPAPGAGRLSVEAGSQRRHDPDHADGVREFTGPLVRAHRSVLALPEPVRPERCEPGESLTIKVYVDHLREPVGPWSARVSIAPAGAVVTIDGYGTAGPTRPRPARTRPRRPGPPRPTPSDPEPTPSDPPRPSDPSPTPSDTTPSDPSRTPPPVHATQDGPSRSEPSDG